MHAASTLTLNSLGGVCLVASPIIIALKLTSSSMDSVPWFAPFAVLWLAIIGVTDLCVHSMAMRKLRTGISSPLWADGVTAVGYTTSSIVLAVFAWQGRQLLQGSLFSVVDGADSSAEHMCTLRCEGCWTVSVVLHLCCVLSCHPRLLLSTS